MKIYDRKPIEFHQLCALVKTLLQQAPTMDDAEWKARSLETMAHWGFDEPADPGMLSRAMMQVEYALKQTIGPRPVRAIPLPASAPQLRSDPPIEQGRTHQPAGWDIVVRLMRKLKGVPASVPSLPKPAGPRETLSISEAAALDEFYRAAHEPCADRIAVLRAFAEVAIVRPADWDVVMIRAEADKPRGLMQQPCFGCRSDGRHAWHHIIQIQHGGSNYVRNIVSLCDACHADVHPWLERTATASRRVKGWTQIGDCGSRLIDDLKHERESA